MLRKISPQFSSREANPKKYSPEAFTMEPENDGFQKESPFPVADFQVNHVKLRGVTLKNPTTEC